MTAFNGYPISVLIAVLCHSLLIAFLLYFERAETEALDLVRPPVVKAILVNQNPQARNEQLQQQQRADNQRAEQQRQEQQRREAQRLEQQRQEQVRQEQQRQQEVAAEQRRVQEQQRVREEQRQQQIADQQAAERRQQEERARQQEELRQQELASQQATATQARLDAEAREIAETEAEMVMAYTAIIHDLVQRQWSRPPSARNGMVVVLRIRLAPTGDILGNVEIVRSSGDANFDRAAETAVLRVNRFSELQGMPPRMFERNFRSLLLTFRPEDLLN